MTKDKNNRQREHHQRQITSDKDNNKDKGK